MPKVAHVQSASESESEDDDFDDQRDDAPTAKGKPLKLSLRQEDKCHVCGQAGHRAGFVGSVYMDCPNKACYLCKQHGHTTLTCPFRLAPGLGCTAARSERSRTNALDMLTARETGGRGGAHVPPPRRARSWQVEAAILRAHTRRCCCLEFAPTNSGVVLSGDKKGFVCIWNFEQVHERTTYRLHWAIVNDMAAVPWAPDTFAATSISGMLKTLDAVTGQQEELLNLNPFEWSAESQKSWRMLCGLAPAASRKLLLAGDSAGVLHCVDLRFRGHAASAQVHKRGSKVNSVACHPLDDSLIMTAGGDHTVRQCDLRALSSNTFDGSQVPTTAAKGRNVAHSSQLAEAPHPRVVNSAVFSPITGQKVLTTCQDNRFRVWDLCTSVGGPPDREIVHSHDFNRYLTAFRADFDPKDRSESLFVCGRYISEDFGGAALHPLDLLNASDGSLVQQLVDANLTTISPVNRCHPTRDIIISGSSRSLYMWTPADQEEEGDKEAGGGASCSDAAAAAARAAVTRSSTFACFDADPSGVGKDKGRKRGREPAEADDSDGFDIG